MKLLNYQNIILTMVVGYLLIGNGIHKGFVSSLSDFAGKVQRFQIDQYAEEVDEIENRELLLDEEIAQNEQLKDSLHGYLDGKIDRRIEHLEAVRSFFQVRKGEIIRSIDQIDEQITRSSDYRSKRMDYVDNRDSFVVVDRNKNPHKECSSETRVTKTKDQLKGEHKTLIEVFCLPRVKYTSGCKH